MKEHPQAEILRAIADGKTIEGRRIGPDCATIDCTTIDWTTIANPLTVIGNPIWELRVKPETMTLAGHKFPAPVRDPLEEGVLYSLVDTTFGPAFRRILWANSLKDVEYLKRGLIQRTEEGAIAQAKAMIAAVGGEV